VFVGNTNTLQVRWRRAPLAEQPQVEPLIAAEPVA
jgi:hypothetical protein